MSFIEIPELVSLRGDKAIEALQELIREFQQQKGKELTEKQAEALVKIANQLIWSIKAETYQATLDKRIKKRVFGFLTRKTLSSQDSIRL
jgi:hypothetical protein